MKLFSTATEQAPGEWFVFRKAEGVEFKVRRLSGSKAREIYLRIAGRVRQQSQKGMTIHLDKEFESRLQQATWCLMDSKNAEVEISDEASAANYTQALGTEVKVGQILKLDGQLGKSAVKELVLTDWPQGVDFILEKARSLGAKSDEEEEDDRGN